MDVKEMMETFGVSERTARRHIARGTMPAARRTIGADGKAYPGSHGSYRHGRRPSRKWTPLSTDLSIARRAVRRVAGATKFTDDDLAEIRIIAAETEALLQRWTIAAETTQHNRSRQQLSQIWPLP